MSSDLHVPIVGERMRVTYDSVHSDDQQTVEGEVAYSNSTSSSTWVAEIDTDDNRTLNISLHAFGVDVKSVNREGRKTKIGEAEHSDVEHIEPEDTNE